MLIAALHNANKGSDRPDAPFAGLRQVLADRGLAIGFLIDLDYFRPTPRKNIIEILSSPMKLLSSNDEIHR